MNKSDLLDLLATIYNKKYIGAVSIDLVQFAINKGLIERTSIGNFQLTNKGEDLLNQQISWDEL